MPDITQERKVRLMAELRRQHPHIGNALHRKGLGFTQLRALGNLCTDPGIMCPRVVSRDKYKRVIYWDDWTEVLEIRNIGPRRMLDLVNFMRSDGVEFPWFAQWDEWSRTPTAYWARISDAERVLPPSETDA